LLPEQGKIGESISEGQILVFDIDSVDIWLRVDLVLKQAQNVLEAEMDLKVEKSTPLTEFNQLMQKLALKVWNECCQVFVKNNAENEPQRKEGLLLDVFTTKKEKEIEPQMKGVLDQAKSLFVLTDFKLEANVDSTHPNSRQHAKNLVDTSFDNENARINDVFSYFTNCLRITANYDTLLDYYNK
jgi:hypothetical protein